jgi:dipeptidyl aminopeptidase/acylaminoacyl peptidase
MVTWEPEGGLVIYDFDTVSRVVLTPETADAFRWKQSDDPQTYQAEFQRDHDGQIRGIGWTTSDGDRHHAKRVENYGYHQTEVRYLNGDIELVGLLLTPLSPGPHPAVVCIHGSGTSDRDNLWYLSIADYLARHGVAVLLPDKRGSGKSGGDWLTSTFDDYADDALAALEEMRHLDTIDPRRIGLISLSQGGWVIPLAADKSENVRFIVSLSGSTVTPYETMRHEVSHDIRDGGVPEFLLPLLEPIFSKRARKRLQVFFDNNGSFDAVPYWRRVSVPALVVNGLLDKNVPVAASLARLEEVKKQNNTAAITIKVYEDSGHGLYDPGTNWFYAEFFESMTAWIHNASR